MSVAALCLGRDEYRYEERAKRYSDEEKKLFGEAFGALFLDMKQNQKREIGLIVLEEFSKN